MSFDRFFSDISSSSSSLSSNLSSSSSSSSTSPTADDKQTEPASHSLLSTTAYTPPDGAPLRIIGPPTILRKPLLFPTLLDFRADSKDEKNSVFCPSPYPVSTKLMTDLRGSSLSSSLVKKPSGRPVPLPDFSNINSSEFEFEELKEINFDDGRLHEIHIPWFASARDHVYSIEQIDDFLENEVQDELPEIRFVLGVDMSIKIALGGVPNEIISAHGQMVNNAFSITSGLAARMVKDNVLVISGCDNGSSYFKTKMQTMQFFYIQLLKTQAYNTGKIRLTDQQRLKDVSPKTRGIYVTNTAKLIARCEELALIYKDTLLSPANLAEYALKYAAPIVHEEPKGVTKVQYEKRRKTIVTETTIATITPPQLITAAQTVISSSPSLNRYIAGPPPTPRKERPKPSIFHSPFAPQTILKTGPVEEEKTSPDKKRLKR